MTESSDTPWKECDFDKISSGWTKFTVTDWLVNGDTYPSKATLPLAIPCFTEDVLTEE